MSFPVAAIVWDDSTDSIPVDIHRTAPIIAPLLGPLLGPLLAPFHSLQRNNSYPMSLPLTLRYDAPLRLPVAAPPVAAVAADTNSTPLDDSTNGSTKLTHAAAFDDTKDEPATCAICWEELSTATVVQIRSCRHWFHQDCFNSSIQHDTKCPVCRAPITDEPIGHGPSGTMQISVCPVPCPGFPDSTTTLQLDYHLPSGALQYAYHENPGHGYSGAHRTAYVPNTPAGRALVARLQYAWMHGLLFRVGTSVTTGATNTVVWSSIHHKTSLSGGAHGFPDDLYVGNCHASLDQVHVPPAGRCGAYDAAMSVYAQQRSATTTWSYTAPVTLAGSAALQHAIHVGPTVAAPTVAPSASAPSACAPVAPVAAHGAGAAAGAPTLTVGPCPSGTMTMDIIHVACPGFDAPTTIEIVYTIPPGRQALYHPNPGVAYTGTSRTTYLPNNVEGRALLWRLRCAWEHGRTFGVGTSLTTGVQNAVVWSTNIAHKTRLSRRSARRDPFGFPDDTYLNTCHAQLDALAIPSAASLSKGADF